MVAYEDGNKELDGKLTEETLRPNSGTHLNVGSFPIPFSENTILQQQLEALYQQIHMQQQMVFKQQWVPQHQMPFQNPFSLNNAFPFNLSWIDPRLQHLQQIVRFMRITKASS